MTNCEISDMPQYNIRMLPSSEVIQFVKYREKTNVGWDIISADQMELISEEFDPTLKTFVRVTNDLQQNPWNELFADQRRGDHEYCDLILRADDGHIRVHRIFLERLSSFVKDLIREAYLARSEDVISITLSGVKLTHLQAFVSMIYGSAGVINRDGHKHILDIMTMLQIAPEDFNYEILPRKKLGKLRVARCFYNNWQESNCPTDNDSDSSDNEFELSSRRKSPITVLPPSPSSPSTSSTSSLHEYEQPKSVTSVIPPVTEVEVTDPMVPSDVQEEPISVEEQSEDKRIPSNSSAQEGSNDGGSDSRFRQQLSEFNQTVKGNPSDNIELHNLPRITRVGDGGVPHAPLPRYTRRTAKLYEEEKQEEKEEQVNVDDADDDGGGRPTSPVPSPPEEIMVTLSDDEDFDEPPQTICNTVGVAASISNDVVCAPDLQIPTVSQAVSVFELPPTPRSDIALSTPIDVNQEVVVPVASSHDHGKLKDCQVYLDRLSEEELAKILYALKRGENYEMSRVQLPKSLAYAKKEMENNLPTQPTSGEEEDESSFEEAALIGSPSDESSYVAADSITQQQLDSRSHSPVAQSGEDMLAAEGTMDTEENGSITEIFAEGTESVVILTAAPSPTTSLGVNPTRRCYPPAFSLQCNTMHMTIGKLCSLGCGHLEKEMLLYSTQDSSDVCSVDKSFGMGSGQPKIETKTEVDIEESQQPDTNVAETDSLGCNSSSLTETENNLESTGVLNPNAASNDNSATKNLPYSVTLTPIAATIHPRQRPVIECTTSEEEPRRPSSISRPTITMSTKAKSRRSVTKHDMSGSRQSVENKMQTLKTANKHSSDKGTTRALAVAEVQQSIESSLGRDDSSVSVPGPEGEVASSSDDEVQYLCTIAQQNPSGRELGHKSFTGTNAKRRRVDRIQTQTKIGNAATNGHDSSGSHPTEQSSGTSHFYQSFQNPNFRDPMEYPDPDRDLGPTSQNQND